MLPIFDDHAHLDPCGMRAEAVRRFKEAGGTHLMVSHMPYGLRPIFSREDWIKDYQFTIDLAAEAQRETGVRVFCVVGPYPGDLQNLMHNSDIPLEKAYEIMQIGVDAAAELVREQKAIGIGEIGRPHYQTDERVMELSNELTLRCMQKAKDCDCPVVIHSENANERNLEEFTSMAKSIGLRPERVVKHFTGKLEDSWPKGGISLSVLATKENVLSAIRQNLNFMMETDYLDDPSRPGAVLPLPTVPKRTIQLSKEGVLDDKLWEKIHVQMPKRSYGLDLSV